MKPVATIMAAAIGLAVIASPASARQVRVPYSDLNLTTAEGQASLQQRVNRAAWQACRFRDDGTLNRATDEATCYRQARKDVAVRVAAITADAQRGG